MFLDELNCLILYFTGLRDVIWRKDGHQIEIHEASARNNNGAERITRRLVAEVLSYYNLILLRRVF